MKSDKEKEDASRRMGLVGRGDFVPTAGETPALPARESFQDEEAGGTL